MRICSTCKRKYEEELNFCTWDGTPLTENVSEPVAAPPPPGVRDPFEITLGCGPGDEPTGPLQMPPSSYKSEGQLRSFGGLERLGPIGKLKKFIFGE
jgi:hypothetical protein